MTETQLRSKIAENSGQAEGGVVSTLRLLNTSTNINSDVIKQAKRWLQEAVYLFEENDKLRKELIKLYEI